MPQDRDPGERRMPIGFNRGAQLKGLSTRELQGTRRWCAEKDDEAGTHRWKDLIDDIDQVLEDRQGLPLGLEFERGSRRSARSGRTSVERSEA